MGRPKKHLHDRRAVGSRAVIYAAVPSDQENSKKTEKGRAHGRSILVKRWVQELASFLFGSQRIKNVKGFFNQLSPAASGPNMSYGFLEQCYTLVTEFANFQIFNPPIWFTPQHPPLLCNAGSLPCSSVSASISWAQKPLGPSVVNLTTRSLTHM